MAFAETDALETSILRSFEVNLPFLSVALNLNTCSPSASVAVSISSKFTLSVERSFSASVSANATIDYEVWPTSVTLRGNLLKSDATNPVFKYRKAGESSWTTVAASVSGNTFSAQVTGLTPGTKYEYATACDGYESSDVKLFTTQAAATIPNGDFETWNTSGKAYLLAADESSMFWDSGNHGSATMNKNITQPDRKSTRLNSSHLN